MADGSVLVIVLLIILLIAVVALVVVAIIALPQIQAAVQAAIVFVQTGIVRIEGLAVSIFDELSFLLSGAFAFVTAVANDIALVITTGINTAIDSVVALGSSVLTTLVNVFDDVKQVVLQISSSVVQFFNLIIQPILDVIVEIFDSVRLLTAQVVCFLSKLICCTLGGGCTPPTALGCCDCSSNCPPGQSCTNGLCT